MFNSITEENAINAICHYLHIDPKNISSFLRDEHYHKKAEECLRSRVLFIRYKQRSAPIRFIGITYDGAHILFAYDGFKNVTVDQHFYTVLGIRLKHPKYPCVIEKRGKSYSYFPLELVFCKPFINKKALPAPKNDAVEPTTSENNTSNRYEKMIDNVCVTFSEFKL